MLEVAFECTLSKAYAHVRQVEQVFHVGPLLLLRLQHPANDAHQLGRVLLRYALVTTLLYLQGQREMVVGLKWWRQVRHLIDNNTKGPNVGLLIVTLLIALLRTHVERTAHVGLRERRLPTDRLGEAKVAKLNVLLVIQEHVRRFEVAM
jgi:hypothetical protein